MLTPQQEIQLIIFLWYKKYVLPSLNDLKYYQICV
jgi:hypothetical protein